MDEKNCAITILCEISIIETGDNIFKEIGEEQIIDLNCLYRLKEFDDYEMLFENETFSDISFLLDGGEFNLHTCILVARSPVFQEMFVEKKDQSWIQITDVGYEILKELFRFTYIGKVKSIEKIVNNLFIAAEKYSIRGLKALCDQILCNNLTIDNVLANLTFANDYNVIELRTEAISLIASNYQHICSKPEFKTCPDDLKLELINLALHKNDRRLKKVFHSLKI